MKIVFLLASIPHAIVWQAATAAADEVRHAEICVHVACAYRPDCPSPEPSPVAEALPLVNGSEPELAAFLYVITHSCINEGVANVYLQRCLDEATFALARAAVRDIFADEIHHARFGWSLLTSDIMRALVARQPERSAARAARARRGRVDDARSRRASCGTRGARNHPEQRHDRRRPRGIRGVDLTGVRPGRGRLASRASVGGPSRLGSIGGGTMPEQTRRVAAAESPRLAKVTFPREP
jgi:hypothetical protein